MCRKVKLCLRWESGLGSARCICYSRRTREYEEQCGKPSAGARFRPERGRRAEHDRDCGHRPVRGQLAGDPGDVAEFDPAVHEASGGNIMGGVRVRLLRPWVQWGEPPVTRVIVRALVSSVEPEGSLGA